MRSGIVRTFPLFFLVLAGNEVSAQSESGGSSSYFIYALIALAIVIFLYIVIQVADNLLAIEARSSNADKKGVNLGLFPGVKEIFAAKAPSYTGDAHVTTLHKGHNILLEGEAAHTLEAAAGVTTYAVQPPNFRGILPIPKVVVEPGQEVKAGDELFHDKTKPEIKFVSPVSGEIIAVNRGEKRAIAEVVILADKTIRYRTTEAPDLQSVTRETLVKFLMESGAWPMLRQRPFDVLAEPGVVPRDIFISTFDTAPLAPDLNFVVEGKGALFQKGLDVLAKLTSGSVHLGLDARSSKAPSAVFTEAAGVQKHWFSGKHPAGNVGVQIHHIKPINPNEKVWTLNVQDVISIGALFVEGRYNAARVVALTGAELHAPKYVQTYIGANMGELVAGNLKAGNIRLVSGDVLSGSKKSAQQFLNSFDDQVTAIGEGDYFEMFGWLLPLSLRPSVSKTFPNFLFPDYKFHADTNTHGEKRAFVVTGQYEEVLPMDVYPQHLMKAILANDIERMEGLGIFEVIEEDVALCEFVCTSKQPLQEILRDGLDTMREEA